MDVYLIQNLCMDYIALTGVNYFLRRGKKKRRMLATAAVSSVGSLCVTLVVRDVNLRILLAVCAVIFTIVLCWLNRRREFGSHIYPLLLLHRGKQVECKGYWDSGNQLRDPYAGRPVSIVSAHIAGKLLERDVDPIRYVPYRSLGKKDGLLAVTDLDAMVLHDGKREKRVSPVQIGIADDDLFAHREYEVLLHASIPVPSEKREMEK